MNRPFCTSRRWRISRSREARSVLFQTPDQCPRKRHLITQGSQNVETIGDGISQPLTPLIRIRQANRIAASEVVASRDELKKAENEIAVKVHEVYYGILIARLQKKAAEQNSAYARTRLSESQEDVRNGSALNVDVIDSQAGLLQSEQTLLTIDLRVSDLNYELNDLLGLPLGTPAGVESGGSDCSHGIAA